MRADREESFRPPKEVIKCSSIGEYIDELSSRMRLPGEAVNNFPGILHSPDQLAPLVEKPQDVRVEYSFTTPGLTRKGISSDIEIPRNEKLLRSANSTVQLAAFAEAAARYRAIKDAEISEQVRYVGFTLDRKLERKIEEFGKKAERLVRGEKVYRDFSPRRAATIGSFALAVSACTGGSGVVEPSPVATPAAEVMPEPSPTDTQEPPSPEPTSFVERGPDVTPGTAVEYPDSLNVEYVKDQFGRGGALPPGFYESADVQELLDTKKSWLRDKGFNVDSPEAYGFISLTILAWGEGDDFRWDVVPKDRVGRIAGWLQIKDDTISTGWRYAEAPTWDPGFDPTAMVYQFGLPMLSPGNSFEVIQVFGEFRVLVELDASGEPIRMLNTKLQEMQELDGAVIPDTEGEGFFELEDKWLEMGYLKDLRRGGEYETVSMEINGERREFLGWRVGFTEILMDKEFLNTEADFGLGGHKNSGETIIPNPNEHEALDQIERVGGWVHAINLGLLERTQAEYDPTWYQRYLDYLAANPEATYELEGNVPKPGEPGSYEIELLGTVDASFPVRFVLLPPRMEQSYAMDRPDKIIGGDPRAPFGLEYANRGEGYYGLKIDSRGRLTALESTFLFDGRLIGGRTSIFGIFSLVPLASANAYYRAPLFSFAPANSLNIYSKVFYFRYHADPYKGGWQRPYLTWDFPNSGS